MASRRRAHSMHRLSEWVAILGTLADARVAGERGHGDRSQCCGLRRRVARVDRGTTELNTDVVWHGRTEDLARLLAAVNAQCACSMRPRQRVCGAHQLLRDQHALDHLAFAHGMRAQFIAQERRVAYGPATRAEKAEWASFLAACRAITAKAEHVGSAAPVAVRHPGLRAGGPLVVALMSLLFLAAIGLPADVTLLPTQQIASWQTR
jgi:hypothetical protein